MYAADGIDGQRIWDSSVHGQAVVSTGIAGRTFAIDRIAGDLKRGGALAVRSRGAVNDYP